MSVRPYVSAAELASLDVAARLKPIYARVQDAVLTPLAKEMERAMHKFRDLEPGDSVTGNPARWDDVRRIVPIHRHRVMRPNLEASFFERPVVIRVNECRSCWIRFNDGGGLQIHAQWLRRITRDEVEAWQP